MREYRCEADKTALLVNRSRLNRGDLVPTERFAHNVETAGERRVAEVPIAFTRMGRSDCRHERLFRIGKFGLRLGQSRRDRSDRFAGSLNGFTPPPEVRS